MATAVKRFTALQAVNAQIRAAFMTGHSGTYSTEELLRRGGS